jgi:RimJ/RimL family protein N-acetyltransferase
MMPATYRVPETFNTERFIVRKALVSDAVSVHQGWATDREVTRYLAWKPHSSMEQTITFLEGAERAWQVGTSFPLLIAPHTAPDEIIGTVEPRSHQARVSYGWITRRDHWGQGVASEVVRWLVDHALAHPAIFRTEAMCDVENIASSRVMEKAGMSREAVLHRYILHPNVSPEPRDAFLYSKVR